MRPPSPRRGFRWREKPQLWTRAVWLARPRVSRLLRYGGAALSALGAFLLRQALAGYIPERLIYWSFYGAVMLAATLGGFGPGLLATALSAAVIAGWILPHPPSAADGVALALFATTAVFMTVLASLYRDARARLAAHEAELARRESEEEFRAFFHNTAVGTAQLDTSGRFLLANGCMCRITGWDERELPGKNLFELVLPEDRDRLEPLFAAFVAGARSSFDADAPLRGRDGRTTWVHATGGRIHDAAGGALRIACVVEDITARREAEAERERLLGALEERDRRKNEFMAMLSHELRNPLAPIRNSVYILEHAEPGGEQSRRARAVIDRQVHQLTHLVDDLLDVNRVARGKIRLRHERLDLAALARRCADDHADVFRASGVELELVASQQPLPVTGDPTRLAQVVGNLLHNAAKFTPAGGRTTLAIEAAGGEAVLSVRDDGPGIAPDALPHLFEPFVQVDSTLDRSRGGLGLGLSLVKSIVEMHGGRVFAHSAGRGSGAEFVVRLPLAPEMPAVAAAEAPERPVAPLPRRVLVVEDNPDTAESLKEALQLAGHRVDVALNGTDGLAAARATRPDVVLCDLGLPGMTGFDVARAMRADPELKSTCLIALTGYALDDDVERCWAAGFDRHMAKPPEPEALAAALAAAPAVSARDGAGDDAPRDRLD